LSEERRRIEESVELEVKRILEEAERTASKLREDVSKRIDEFVRIVFSKVVGFEG
jgi:vacuolar-type H+-ATPase subunit E/Vma4